MTLFLHFADNAPERPVRGQAGYDPLWKILPRLDLFEKCRPVYTPSCEWSINESIIKFKGRVHLRQYLPSIPYGWEIKQYLLCENKIGYAMEFITYTCQGSIELAPGFSITGSICLSLLSGFQNRDNKAFTDIYYTSSLLYRELERRGICACGTVKAGRINLPMDSHPF